MDHNYILTHWDVLLHSETKYGMIEEIYFCNLSRFESILNLEVVGIKGPFNNYVEEIWPKFDPLPPRVDKLDYLSKHEIVSKWKHSRFLIYRISAKKTLPPIFPCTFLKVNYFRNAFLVFSIFPKNELNNVQVKLFI